jgi:hypothetical protein
MIAAGAGVEMQRTALVISLLSLIFVSFPRSPVRTDLTSKSSIAPLKAIALSRRW